MTFFMYNSKKVKLSRAEQVNDSIEGVRRDRDGEDVSSYACQSKHQEACCMQHVISSNFLELTASIRLYAISFTTTLNTGTDVADLTK